MPLNYELLNALNDDQREALANLLLHPYAMKDAYNYRHIDVIESLVTPDIDGHNRIAIFERLGYIKTREVTRDLRPSDRAILEYWMAHPSASYEETSDAIGYTLHTVRVRVHDLYKQYGINERGSSASRLKRLELFKKLRWLNRRGMTADARDILAYTPPPPHNPAPLYPLGVTSVVRNVLYNYYMNPLASYYDIAERAYCSHNYIRYVVWETHETSRRVEVYNKLGYIKFTQARPFRGRIQRIYDDWRVYPDATFADMSDRLGITQNTINTNIRALYKKSGYDKSSVYTTTDHRRLGFYWYMGIFDMTRLRADAKEQYDISQSLESTP